MPSVRECTSCPPFPLNRLQAYLTRLSKAFGADYVAAVVMCYGINQGVGEGFIYFARRYYLLDDVGLSPKHTTQLLGFASIPWQLKSLFGLLSDLVPINGLHRSPYMILAGVVGVVATSLITVFPASAFGADAYALIFMAAK